MNRYFSASGIFLLLATTCVASLSPIANFSVSWKVLDEDTLSVSLTFPPANYGAMGLAENEMNGIIVGCFVREPTGFNSPYCHTFHGPPSAGILPNATKQITNVTSATVLPNSANVVFNVSMKAWGVTVGKAQRVIFATGPFAFPHSPSYHGKNRAAAQINLASHLHFNFLSFSKSSCDGALTSNQSYSERTCYSEVDPTGSYFTSFTLPTADALVVSFTDHGADGSCSTVPPAQRQPEVFPCDVCMSFGSGYAIFANCSSGAPLLKSACDATCGSCARESLFRFGVGCQQFDWFDGGFMSLAAIAVSQGYITYSNFASQDCSGPLLYAQPVPIGMCMNGTMVVL